MRQIASGQVDDSAILSGWRFRAAMISVALAAAAYLCFALWSGWQDVLTAVVKVGALGVLVALSLSLVNYCLRFIRWQAFLRAMGHPVPWQPSLSIYLAGFALTTTPGKAGEALRGVLLKRWGLPYSKSFAAFLSERLSDLLAIVILSLFGLMLYPAAHTLIVIAGISVVAAFLALSNFQALNRLQASIQGTSQLLSLLRTLFQVLKQARQCHTPQLLAMATGLSLLAWAAEAWAFHLVLSWMGLDLPLRFAVFVYAISMLAGALSFMPGGLGSAEAVMALLLISAGVEAADAVAATILIRIATLWFAVVLGSISLMRQR